MVFGVGGWGFGFCDSRSGLQVAGPGLRVLGYGLKSFVFRDLGFGLRGEGGLRV